MRIGIDATALPPKPAGAGVYMIHLIRNLVSLDSERQFVIFAHKNGQTLINIPANESVNWVVLGKKTPAMRLVWEQTSLPVLVKRHRIDLFHSLHYTRPLLLPCHSVVTFHDMTFFLHPHLHTRAKRFFFPKIIRASAKLADALVAVSENTRKDAIRLLAISPSKISTTPIGVSYDFRPISDKRLLESVRRKYNLPQRFILHVGTIEPRKNLPLLIRAFSALNSMGHAEDLVIAGQLGWMYDEVLQQVKTLGLDEKVHFTGYIPANDLPIVYNLAQILVYPSTYEGFGIPPLEAMACGIPVITSAVSAMADHVGSAGLLISPQNEGELTKTMHTLLSDRILQKQLSLKGQQQASLFTWKRTAQETLKVYQHLEINR